MRALLAKRGEHAGGIDHPRFSESLLSKAQLVRRQAQAQVQRQESSYRYPVDLIARRRTSMTAYPFWLPESRSKAFFLGARRGAGAA